MAKDLPSQEEIDRVLVQHVPDYRPGEPFAIVPSLRDAHSAYHKIAHRAAVVMKVLKEQLGLSWLQIYNITGVEPTTARRWVEKLADHPEPDEDWKP